MFIVHSVNFRIEYCLNYFCEIIAIFHNTNCKRGWVGRVKINTGVSGKNIVYTYKITNTLKSLSIMCSDIFNVSSLYLKVKEHLKLLISQSKFSRPREQGSKIK